MRIVGWMPLKLHSTRLPGKNWRNLGGKPLWRHMADTMKWVCDEVFINTDNEEIETLTTPTGPRIIKRRPEHRDPKRSTVDMLVDDLNVMQADVVVYTHATIPLLKLETLRAAIQFFVDTYPRYDSVISVTRFHERFYNHLGVPVNFKRDQVIPLQDMPPVYLENSAFFILHSHDLARLHRRVGDRPYMYEIDPDEAVEIDTEQDFEHAEYLYRREHDRDGDRNYRQYVAECSFETADMSKLFDAKINAGRIIE